MRLLKEPLVHFLALGAVLFGIGLLRGDAAEPASNRIALSPGVVERLLEGFRMTWQRPPTESEFQGLVTDYLREEVLYREAIAMGLDRDDQIIRRRMRQKLEFMTADFVESIAPTDEELQTYLDANPDRYRQGSVSTFVHVYFREGDDAESRATDMIGRLQADPQLDPALQGDPFMYPAFHQDLTERDVLSVFGEQFADELAGLPIREWSGPVSSAFGSHAVWLEERIPGGLPSLDEVRAIVYRDLVGERTNQAEQQYFEGLLSQYTVTVDWPEGMEPVSIPGVVP